MKTSKSTITNSWSAEDQTTHGSNTENDKKEEEEKKESNLLLVELSIKALEEAEHKETALQQLPNPKNDKAEDMNQHDHSQEEEQGRMGEAYYTNAQGKEEEKEKFEGGENDQKLHLLDQQDHLLEPLSVIERGEHDLTRPITPPQVATRVTATSENTNGHDQKQRQGKPEQDNRSQLDGGGTSSPASLKDHFAGIVSFIEANNRAPEKDAAKVAAAPPSAEKHGSGTNMDDEIRGVPPPPPASPTAAPYPQAEENSTQAATAVSEHQDIERNQSWEPEEFFLTTLLSPIPDPVPRRASPLPGAFPVLGFASTTTTTPATDASGRNAPGVLTLGELETEEQDGRRTMLMSREEMPATNSEEMPVATVFEPSEMEAEIRHRIINEAVQATSVVPVIEASEETWSRRPDEENQSALRKSALSNNMLSPSSCQFAHRHRSLLLLMGGIFMLAIALTVYFVVLWDNNNKTKTTPITNNHEVTPSVAGEDLSRPTIDLVRERGVVRCGVDAHIFGVSRMDPKTGRIEGLNVEYCRAISMAVFGTPDNAEIFHVELFEHSFTMLFNGTMDVLALGATHTMERDVFQGMARTGLTFTTPYFYSGLLFGGLPEYVECADRLDSLNGICRDLRLCVVKGTTHERILQDKLPGALVVPGAIYEDIFDNFKNGTCQVIVSEPYDLSLQQVRSAGWEGEFALGDNLLSREPLSFQTRQTDSDWSNLINLIVNIFFLAEAHNISQSNAERLLDLFPPSLDAKDESLASNMEAVVRQFGNYGDIFTRSEARGLLAREGISLNYIYDWNSDPQAPGILYSFPFGAVDVEGPGPVPGSIMASIMSRGYLRCGVNPQRGLGFAQLEKNTWTGLDVEFCRVLSAALFRGNTSAVEFVAVEDVTSPGIEKPFYYKNLTALEEGHVDVLAGVQVTLLADYHGLKFSPGYYYDNQRRQAFAMATLDSNGQFGDFVYWVVMAMIYAEENGIGTNTSASMPVIRLFGEGLKQMLRDTVQAHGSYGDIYNRTLQSTIPRAGANLLNRDHASGPQHFPVPLWDSFNLK